MTKQTFIPGAALAILMLICMSMVSSGRQVKQLQPEEKALNNFLKSQHTACTLVHQEVIKATDTNKSGLTTLRQNRTKSFAITARLFKAYIDQWVEKDSEDQLRYLYKLGLFYDFADNITAARATFQQCQVHPKVKQVKWNGKDIAGLIEKRLDELKTRDALSLQKCIIATADSNPTGTVIDPRDMNIEGQDARDEAQKKATRKAIDQVIHDLESEGKHP